MTKIFDVTVPLSADVPVFPGDPRFQMEFSHRIADGEAYNVARITPGGPLRHARRRPVSLPGRRQHRRPAARSRSSWARPGWSRSPARERIERADLEALDLRDDLRVLLKTRMSGQLRSRSSRRTSSTSPRTRRPISSRPGSSSSGFDYLSVETLRQHGLRGPPRPARGRRRHRGGARPLRGRARRVRHDVPAPADRGGRRRRPPGSSCGRARLTARRRGGGPHERPAPARRGGRASRGRRRRAALPADPRPGQARGLLRRPVPHHRLHALELHQLRACARSSSPPSTRPRA